MVQQIHEIETITNVIPPAKIESPLSPAKSDQIGARLNFLCDFLTRGITVIRKTENSKINRLWSELRDNMAAFHFYDDRFYFDICVEYAAYCDSLGTKTAPDIIVPLMLQRMAGPGQTFNESARTARDRLKYGFNLPHEFCDHVFRLISSLGDVDFSSKVGPHKLLSQLQLARLSVPFPDFLFNQDKIFQDAFFLNKLEFLKAQKQIYKSLFDQEKIFDNFWFNERHETKVRANLRHYLIVLSNKLDVLDFSKGNLKTPQDITEKIKNMGREIKKLGKSIFTIQDQPVNPPALESLESEHYAG